MLTSIRRFLQSLDFFKSLVLLVGLLAPLGLLYGLDRLPWAVGVLTGVFLCAPSDVPGSYRHRVVGILAALATALLTTLLIHWAAVTAWLLLPVLALLAFANSMLAVYGFRASLVSLAGLLAIVLAFAQPLSGSALFQHLGLMALGGVWYLGLTLAAYRLAAKRHGQLLLAEAMRLTADYLRLRGEQLIRPAEAEAIQERLFELQRELNDQHEKLRELFIADRGRSGASADADRLYLVFIELVDVLELAVSRSANHMQLRPRFAEDPVGMQPLTDIAFALADRLRELSEIVRTHRRRLTADRLAAVFQLAEQSLATKTQTADSPAEAVAWRNWLDSKQRQRRKIENIARVLSKLAEQEQLTVDRRVARQFITQQDYDPRLLWQHLSGESAIFRHAVRLTATILLGYAVGAWLPVQNGYWIMLTIVVIMRPNYGLTKERSKKRVLGTLIGGGIAVGIVLLTQHPVIYGLLTTVSLLFAFALIQKNYTASAAFITLMIVFLYALLQPDAFTVIQFRVIDTVIGAALAFLAGLLIWPIWESETIQPYIVESIQANRNYLQAINTYYEQKGELPASYKLARKEAFLAVGHLSAALQRMTQDPKSRQRHLSDVYELVVLNHTFLNALAAMGVFIRNHETTSRSEHFVAFVEHTDLHLAAAQEVLLGHQPEKKSLEGDIEQADHYLTERFGELAANNRRSTEAGAAVLPKLQEAGLLGDQLRWLHDLAERIAQAAARLKTPAMPGG